MYFGGRCPGKGLVFLRGEKGLPPDGGVLCMPDTKLEPSYPVPATGGFPVFCRFWLGATGAAEAAATKRAQTMAVKRIVVDSEDKTK